jgi:hypothetical protein
LLSGQHLVLPHRVQDDELDRGLRAGEAGRELGRAPGGDEAEKAFGRGEVADVVGDHAVVAMQGELDASAEGRSVDRGDSRVRQGTDAPEEVMARAASLDRLLAQFDEGKLVQVGAPGEASRLPGDDEGGEVARLELGQELGERLERSSAEDVRATLAGSVVHRDEGHRVDTFQAELGHRFAHCLASLGFRAMADWAAHVEREIERYRDGEQRLPDAADSDTRQRQLTRMGNAAGGAGLSHLMDGRVEEASEWLHRAAERYRESMDEAPPNSWGRPIGSMKALVLAGDWAGAEEAARWALELGAAEAESPIGRYAGSLALLVLSRDSEARPLAGSIREREDFPRDVADALATLAASDRLGYVLAVESVLESFETRDEYLEDIAVADTVLVLQALAARREIAAELASPLLPSSG